MRWGGDDRWPDGAVAPMAKEACDVLLSACNSTVQGPFPVFVFLIGGAGNGKSKLAGDVIRAVRGTAKEPPEAFARRIYNFHLANGGRFTVVNDATIPPPEQTALPPLVSDVAIALEGQTNLLVCVNRGVLIGEAGAPPTLLDQPTQHVAQALLKWVLDSTRGEPTLSGGWTISPSAARGGPLGHYRYVTVRFEGKTQAALHVVYMDQASLLEPWPKPGAKQFDLPVDAALEVRPLSVVPLLRREFGNSAVAAFAPSLSQAARNFSEDLHKGGPGGDIDPVLANAAALSNLEVADSWCALMRGAEVISGVRFTYRELWALFGHSLIGGPPESGLSKLSDWVAKQTQIAKEGADLTVRLNALMALAQLRTHMVLFGGSRIRAENASPSSYPWPHVSNEALQSVSLADPLRDYGPAGGHAYSDLVDVISGIEEGRFPGQQLAKKDMQVAKTWSTFDTYLETIVAELVMKGSDRPELKRRNFVLSWYGQYLFRLVALAKGWPAHTSIIDRWQQSWLEAGGNGRLPAELEQSVLRVLLPGVAGQAQVRFPLLRPRIETVPEGESHISVEVAQQLFVLSAGTQGDQIVINVRREGHAAAETILDFHLVREAEARARGHGFTDSMLLVEPRLERMRASVLAYELRRGVTGSRPRYVFRHNADFYVG